LKREFVILGQGVPEIGSQFVSAEAARAAAGALLLLLNFDNAYLAKVVGSLVVELIAELFALGGLSSLTRLGG
jgi:hypothetical protein